MKQINTAVIPVAGFGTRMLPATKSIPKELLPILNKPVIHYVVNEAVQAGIKQIILVNHSSKVAIENYFDNNFELQSQLEDKGKSGLLNDLDNLTKDVSISSVRQPRALGLGHAILTAKELIGGSDFAVLLPDVIIDPFTSNSSTDNMASMRKRYADSGVPQIMVNEVAAKDVSLYGIADCGDKELLPGAFSRVSSFIEKPSPKDAPSRFAVVGRYILPNDILSILENTSPGAGGEIQLTDAIDQYLDHNDAEVYSMIGQSYDCGSVSGYLEAILNFASNDENLSSVLTKFFGDRFAS
ncbi:MAG: UTP--glucose-1-phosphate uridylyltransferase [Gammaproteobacteria bacterium]|nr:UTP--glucose-1-phosphate uridylyltransferase [Gammaproteobacteria bacterium]